MGGVSYIFKYVYKENGASQVALVVKNLPASAGDLRDMGLIPGLGRFLGEGHGNPLQHSCLENLMDRGAWWVKVHWVAESQTQLNRLSTSIIFIYSSSENWDYWFKEKK